MTSRSLAKQVWYSFLRISSRLLGVALFRIRCRGRENWPAEGGAMVLANHQSLFDPVLVGLTCNRRLNYLARESLFRWTPFRWLIESLDAIPVDREGLGLDGLKETLRRLKRGEMVLIFPEGTRTLDGDLGTIRPGFSGLARRAKVPLVPVGIDGAYHVWPRNSLIPRPWGVIQIEIGKPIGLDEIAQHDERELVAIVEQRLAELHAQARKHCHSLMNASHRRGGPDS